MAENTKKRMSAVGIEPTTRGLRVPPQILITTRKDDRTRVLGRTAAGRVPEKLHAVGSTIRAVSSRKPRGER